MLHFLTNLVLPPVTKGLVMTIIFSKNDLKKFNGPKMFPSCPKNAKSGKLHILSLFYSPLVTGVQYSGGSGVQGAEHPSVSHVGKSAPKTPKMKEET